MGVEREPQYFDSPEEMMDYLRQKCDDIEAVHIPVQTGLALVSPEGRRRNFPGAGAAIKLCTGETSIIHREDAERLINDGILQRLKIRCVLDPMEPSS